MKKIIRYFSLLIGFTASFTSLAREKISLMLDWYVNPDHAAIIVAQQKGFFEKNNLDVEIIEPADPSLPPKLVAAGKVDLAINYQPQLYQQVSEGLPLVRVGSLISSPLNSVVVLKNSNIKTILVTVGLADVNNKENTNNIKASLEKQLEKDIYKNSLIFHLRGGIDYSKLNFKHKTMMKMLYHSLKNKPVESLTQEDKALIETYNTKVDFADYDSLKQIVEVIQ